MNQKPAIAPSADVSLEASIGSHTVIWDHAQVREHATIGERCVIGRSAYIGAGVTIGSQCKVQNNALLYEPAVIADHVFVGPAAVLTNDRYPRASNPDGSLKSSSDWETVGVTVQQGASIGANATCVAPIIVGNWAMIAAGSVVIRDVRPFEIVAGNPARHIGWVGHAGVPLVQTDAAATKFRCPQSGRCYTSNAEGLAETVNAP